MDSRHMANGGRWWLMVADGGLTTNMVLLLGLPPWYGRKDGDLEKRGKRVTSRNIAGCLGNLAGVRAASQDEVTSGLRGLGDVSYVTLGAVDSPGRSHQQHMWPSEAQCAGGWAGGP